MNFKQRIIGLRRLQLAAMLQFALPGVPCIYYGDEAGLDGYRDPFNRGTYPWGHEDAEMVAWYRALGAARAAAPELAEGAFCPVPTDGDVVCFVRRQGEQALLCAVNRGAEERQIFLPADFGDAQICLGDGVVVGHTLVLPPLGGVWMRL